MNINQWAILVVDIQDPMVEKLRESGDHYYGFITQLKKTLSLPLPVYFVEQYSHPSVHELTSHKNGIRVGKLRPSAFERPVTIGKEIVPLSNYLRSRGINKLIVSGVDAPSCTTSSIADAIDEGFEVASARDLVIRGSPGRHVEFPSPSSLKLYNSVDDLVRDFR